MSFFRRMFTPSSNSKYLFNTLESLKELDSGQIVLYFDKINPNIWENSSYNDSKAIDILGKDRFRALMFSIGKSHMPAEKRLEIWEKKEQEKGIKKMLSSAPSTRNMDTPGWREEEEELRQRFSKLKEGGKRKSKKTRVKSIRKKSIRKKSKNIKIKSKSKKIKSIRRKSMKM